ncbi:MAG: transporter [Pseudonocardia sp.]|nr:transporter [Pseudonocardia sp.]
MLLTAGALRACWLFGLVFIRPGIAGLVLVMAVELGLIICMSVFNPVFAIYRLEQTATDHTPQREPVRGYPVLSRCCGP